MQPVSPHRWRALPTALLVIAALALGAVTARADDGSGSARRGEHRLGDPLSGLASGGARHPSGGYPRWKLTSASRLPPPDTPSTGPIPTA